MIPFAYRVIHADNGNWMSSQAFLWISIGCAFLLVLLFIVGRKGITAPSRLNLRRGGSTQKQSDRSRAVSPQKKSSPDVHFQSAPTDNPKEKSLNVMFMYNGHNFDAYEVLGAPAGASLEMAQKYFQQSLARAGSDREFLETALTAIKHCQRR